ncbi:MAG: hypothetical protein AB7R69_01425 [Candidatus Babeliales bacterium]
MNIQNRDFFLDFQDFIVTYKNYIMGVLGFAAIGFGGFIYWYQGQAIRNQNALQALSEVLSEHKHAYENADLWQDVEVGAKTGYRQYSSASIAPFFLGLQADALLEQDKKEEAYAVMKTMLEKLSSHSPLYPLYSIKYARMLLADDNEAVQKDGLALLQKYADQEGANQDQARYYLGLYYFGKGQKKEAESLWQPLIEQGSKDNKEDRSVWSGLAEQHLK